ncbi:hypothetical protein K466DRAFT_101796 [Polyporus arcularius HHB13444]|uniref:Uncharacterized protein n=1 Tax=Polyporus arcularius HHB13444 TaxID=1314778 RepID=A0A5C3PDA1_9APHY|nr:hypothetical protein K466DRAFT_101796 [Polyporus arcularius HHB13444]
MTCTKLRLAWALPTGWHLPNPAGTSADQACRLLAMRRFNQPPSSSLADSFRIPWPVLAHEALRSPCCRIGRHPAPNQPTHE